MPSLAVAALAQEALISEPFGQPILLVTCTLE
jgi:hypothetical protein